MRRIIIALNSPVICRIFMYFAIPLLQSVASLNDQNQKRMQHLSQQSSGISDFYLKMSDSFTDIFHVLRLTDEAPYVDVIIPYFVECEDRLK